MTDTPSRLVDVLICTYKRPEMLLRTLAGIERAAHGVDSVRIIVVDNDALQSAAHITEQWAANSVVPLTYLTQPVQNISLTRNMALENASAEWLALIDDDEVPEENWLRALLQTAEQYEAEVVFGPVISEFEPDAPAWATRGTLFQRKRFATGTTVPPREARTGNVLMRSACLARDRFRFDPELGLSGGEDSEFFTRLHDAGRKMVWCDEACVRETTPSSRTRLGWVLKRGFRIGSVEAYNSRRFGRLRKTLVASVKSLVFMAQGGVLTVCWAPFSSARAVQGMRRAAMGAGYFYGLIGQPYSEYHSPRTAKKSIR